MDVATYLASDKADLGVFVGVDRYMVHSYTFPCILYIDHVKMDVWNYREMKIVHVEAIKLLPTFNIISNTQLLVQVDATVTSSWLCQALNQKFGGDRNLN